MAWVLKISSLLPEVMEQGEEVQSSDDYFHNAGRDSKGLNETSPLPLGEGQGEGSTNHEIFSKEASPEIHRR